MIRKAMQQSEQSFKDEYELLIKNGYLDTLVSMETSFYEQSKTENLWGLFVNAGYLTISQYFDGDFCRVVVPNQEVQKEFKTLTADYLNIEGSDLERICYALRMGNQEQFIKTYQQFLIKYPSYYDLINENSYHMIWICLGAGLNGMYEVKSNREEGKGRCDLILKAKQSSQPSYVLEFKYSKEEHDLDTLANTAIQQIEERQYDVNLEGTVIYIGLAHCGKKVAIQWVNKEEL